MGSAASSIAQCQNCSASLSGPYCSECGQKVIALNPTLRDFVGDFAHEVTDLDGKFIPTVRLLLTKPGFLSREHFDGRRARYVSPIRLYLIFSLLYFVVATFAPLSGPEIHCTSCTADTKAETEAAMRAAFIEWFPRTMFVLMPILAGLVAIAARKSGRNYPQHLYFAMHLHAAWFLVGAIAGPLGMIPAATVNVVVRVGALLCVAAYMTLAFRRAYDASLLRSAVSTLAIGAVYGLLIMVTLFSIVLPAAALHEK